MTMIDAANGLASPQDNSFSFESAGGLQCDPTKVVRSRSSCKFSARNFLRAIFSSIIALMLTPAIGVTLVLVLCAAAVSGEGLAYWVTNRTRIKESVFRNIVKANLIAWFIPPVGMFLGALTFGLTERQITEESDRRIFRAIALAAIVFSVIHAIV